MIQEVSELARKKVLPTVEKRAKAGGNDRGLWKKLADTGLLGAAMERKYGGTGGTVSDFVTGVSVLAAEGCDLGLALSVLDHVMLCAYPLRQFASEGLKKRYLPGLCGGELVGAAAVSEPGSGADPAQVRTRAERSGEEYVITGEKEPVTNAPVADLFLVVAATDPEAGKRGLSAFVVPRADGVRVEPLELGYLDTSPHGKVVLEGARVPRDHLVGEEGWGHERISRSLFVWERVAAIPVVVAFMERWHHLVVSPLDPEGIPPGLRVSLAQRKVELTAYRVLGERLLDLTFGDVERGRERLELLLFFGKALPAWVRSMHELVEKEEIPLEDTALRMLRDLRLLETGRSVLEMQLQNLL